MQVNSVSNGLNFGALSPELHENMWQAVKRNCPTTYLSKDINKSKLYQDYKKILDYTSGEDCLFVEASDPKDRNTRLIIGRNINDNFVTNDEVCDVTEACYAEDKYKEMIKIFAKWIKS